MTLGFGEIVRLILVNADVARRRPGHLRHPDAPEHRPLRASPASTGHGVAGRRPRQHDDVPQVRGDRLDPLLLAGPRSSSCSCCSSTGSMQNCRVGRAWEATREDEDAAELMGVPTFRFKLLAFAHRRRHRWPVRGPVRHQAALHHPGQLHHPATVDPVRRHGRRRWPGQPLGRHRRRASARRYFPERFRCLADAAFLLFGLALMAAGDLPAAGPAAADDGSVRAKRADDGQADASRKERPVSDTPDQPASRRTPRRPSSRPPRRAAHVDDAATEIDADVVHRSEDIGVAEPWPRARVLEVDDVTLRFGGVTALDDVSLPHQHGRDPRPDRAQRRRQDDLLQRDDRRLPAHLRWRCASSASRSASARSSRSPSWASRARSRTSGCSQHDGARERPGRRRRAPLAPASCSALFRLPKHHAEEAEGMDRAYGAAQVHGPGQAGRRARPQPALRRPAPARDRARPRHEPEAALPRRAGCRLQPGGEGRAHGADPVASATRATPCCSSSTT